MSIKNQGGFTLVEIAIVVPLMIILVIGLIGLLIALVNGIALPTKQNVLVNSGENVFDAASKDIKNGSGFVATVPATFSDTNASDYASPPSGTQVLMVKGYNQVIDSADTTGTKTLPAFKGATAPCAVSKDNIATILSVYFVNNGTLWRRVLTESTPGATCGTPLIKQSCAPTELCSIKDTPISKDSVTDFTLTYFTTTDGTVTTPDPTMAKSVQLSIKGSTKSGGHDANFASTIRVGLVSDQP